MIFGSFPATAVLIIVFGILVVLAFQTIYIEEDLD